MFASLPQGLFDQWVFKLTYDRAQNGQTDFFLSAVDITSTHEFAVSFIEDPIVCRLG
jgi:hypothetical protein